MTAGARRDVPARFRQQLLAANLLRWCLVAALVAGLFASFAAAGSTQGWIIAGMAALVGIWMLLALRTLRQVRTTRSSAALLAQGRIEEARRGLLLALNGLTPLRSVTILACHYLAVAAHLSRSYREAIALCRELLAHPLGSMKNLATATRLILADSLLMLDEVDAASLVVQSIDGTKLSLADRLTFLPIELRYQLITDQAGQAVESLPEKVHLAELLDPWGAALTHALLAEACRRTNLIRQQDYLLRRATLLADLEPIIARYEPLLNSLAPHAGASGSPDSSDPDR